MFSGQDAVLAVQGTVITVLYAISHFQYRVYHFPYSARGTALSESAIGFSSCHVRR